MKCLLIQVSGFLLFLPGIIYGHEKQFSSISSVLGNDFLSCEVGYYHTTFSSDTITGKIPEKAVPEKKNGRVYTAIDSLYLPIDSLKNRTYGFQVLEENSHTPMQAHIDTTLARFDINNPVMKNYYAGSYLGNAGLSYYPIGFEKRSRPSDFLFTDNISLYMHSPERVTYYQTKVPYTLIDYSSAGSKKQNESILKVVHTQNVNKEWNVGLDYDLISSAGQYLNQNAADNAFTLFSSYRGKQYSLFANFNLNNIRMKENGGLSDLEYFRSEDVGPESYTVRSMSGKTIMLNRSLYFLQSYSFKKLNLGRKSETVDSADNVSRFTLVQTFKYEWNKRTFTDTENYTNHDPYFNTLNTNDSVYFRRIFNHFELMVKEKEHKNFTAGFSVGLMNEFDHYNANILPVSENSKYTKEPSVPGWGIPVNNEITHYDTVIYYRESKNYVNTAVTGRFFNHTGRYLNWDFNGRLYFTGYKIGDLNINGTVQLHYYTSKGRNSVLLGGSIDNAHPSYFLNRYASNLFAWNNDFDQSQEIRLRGEFISPHLKFKAGAYVSQLNNYVYINSSAVPQQASDALIVGIAYLEKDIRWWKLGFRFRLYGQYTSHEKIIPLPAFAGYQSTYFEAWLVRNVLKMQFGWDLNYHTAYYAYDYMPNTGMFYLQDESQGEKIGNYPFLDFFLNFQIKRARVFVKTEGLNTEFGFLGKDYFMVYRYPMNTFRVKFGLSWAFYD